jgi:hypothetical protein
MREQIGRFSKQYTLSLGELVSPLFALPSLDVKSKMYYHDLFFKKIKNKKIYYCF